MFFSRPGDSCFSYAIFLCGYLKRLLIYDFSFTVAKNKIRLRTEKYLSPTFLLECACTFKKGKGSGQQVLVGSDIELNNCATKCTDERRTSSSINGAMWEENGKKCFCKYDMKDINQNDASFKSCFLKGKVFGTSLKGKIWVGMRCWWPDVALIDATFCFTKLKHFLFAFLWKGMSDMFSKNSYAFFKEVL